MVLSQLIMKLVSYGFNQTVLFYLYVIPIEKKSTKKSTFLFPFLPDKRRKNRDIISFFVFVTGDQL